MKRISLLTALAFTCAFNACKKDNEKPKSTADLLMAKTWKITAKSQIVGSAAPVDITGAYGPCYLDNTYKFDANYQFTSDEGALRCLPVQTYSGGWGLANNDKMLTVVAVDQPSGFSVSFHGTIDEISASKFVLSEEVTSSITNKTTFTAQ